jgi:hypothetical protein
MPKVLFSYFPLPLRERVRVRGEKEKIFLAAALTAHFL